MTEAAVCTQQSILRVSSLGRSLIPGACGVAGVDPGSALSSLLGVGFQSPLGDVQVP